MVEDRFNKQDQMIRSMMENAAEEVPSRVWDAIDTRLPRKDAGFAPAWLKFAGVAFAAVVAVLLTLTLTGTFSHSTIDISPSKEQDARVAVVSRPVDAVSEQSQVDIELIKSETNKTTSSKIVFPAVSGDEAEHYETEHYVADVPSDDISSSSPAYEKQEGIEIKDMSKDDWDTYFGEEKDRKSSRKVAIGVKGLFGSNDGVSQKSILSTAWSAPVKKQSYTTGVSETSSSVFGIPVTFGLGVRFYITERFSVGTGLDFSILTRSFSGDFIKADNNHSKILSLQNADIVNRQNYIGIPVNLYYDFLQTDILRFYGFSGATFEKGISNSFNVQADNLYEKFNSDISGIQSSVAAGLGIQFKVSDNWGIFIDPSARYYFDCKQPTNVRTVKPFMFNFEVGARFNIINR